MGHDAVVGTLLAAGADRALSRHDGTSPMEVARKAGHQRVVALLSGRP
jgi:ankyrin repeat protein